MDTMDTEENRSAGILPAVLSASRAAAGDGGTPLIALFQGRAMSRCDEPHSFARYANEALTALCPLAQDFAPAIRP